MFKLPSFLQIHFIQIYDILVVVFLHYNVAINTVIITVNKKRVYIDTLF